MRNVVIIVAILLVGLLFVQFAGLRPVAVAKPGADSSFAQKANLALRRTAHYLLAEGGDSVSRIAPVQQTSAGTFVVRLERPFAYNRLPALLQESFAVHGIRANYDVAVLDCANGELQLGYNFLDVSQKREIPCGGRQQGQGCYTLQVTFAQTAPPSRSIALWWAVAIGGLLVGFVYVAWQRIIPNPKSSSRPVPISDSNKPESPIRLGQSWFNVANQSVDVAGVQHSLTYREAKLLRFFINHPNQVVERDFILKSVWEDEGVIVGRSVDVFVSRLRKLLHADPSVRFVAVHGVGYRFDVQ